MTKKKATLICTRRWFWRPSDNKYIVGKEVVMGRASKIGFLGLTRNPPEKKKDWTQMEQGFSSISFSPGHLAGHHGAFRVGPKARISSTRPITNKVRSDPFVCRAFVKCPPRLPSSGRRPPPLIEFGLKTAQCFEIREKMQFGGKSYC